MQKEGISSINNNGDDEVSDNSETIYMPKVADKDQGNSNRSEIEVVETKKKKPTGKTTVIKGFKANILDNPKMCCKSTTFTQANEAISAIGSFFSSDKVKECNQQWATHEIEKIQVQAVQAELHDLQMRYMNLQEKYMEATRRADTLQHKLDMYDILRKQQHQYHQHHYSSSSSSSSYVLEPSSSKKRKHHHPKHAQKSKEVDKKVA